MKHKTFIKTLTYLVLDMLVHSIIVYFAGRLFGFKISAGEAGIVGVAIEIVETVAYYFHEKVWEGK